MLSTCLTEANVSTCITEANGKYLPKPRQMVSIYLTEAIVQILDTYLTEVNINTCSPEANAQILKNLPHGAECANYRYLLHRGKFLSTCLTECNCPF